jgi:hypothetical protein
MYIGQWENNSMHGYGEFRWKDGKYYAGNYVEDRKEGFGIYYWTNPQRAYIGFWKNGKQDGVGKYINPKMSRFGIWREGERTKWYNNEKEAFNSLKNTEKIFKDLFQLTMQDVFKLFQ